MDFYRINTTIEAGASARFTAADIASQAGIDPTVFSFRKIAYIDPLTNVQLTAGPMCSMENGQISVDLADLEGWNGSFLVTIYGTANEAKVAIVLTIKSA
jgi:hypothetical protein